MTMPGPLTNGYARDTSARSVELWDTLGLSKEQVDDLGGRMGMTVRPSRALTSTSPRTSSGDGDANAYAPAVALALVAARSVLPLDFADSKLAVAPPRRFSNRAIWATVVGAVIVIGLTVLYVDTLQRESEVADVRSRLASMKTDLDSARTNLAQVGYGRQYFDNRPATLAAVREVTAAFRDDEPIWLTSFSIRDGKNVTIAGKAASDGPVLAVRDRLARSPHLSDVNAGEIRNASNKSTEKTFSIKFVYSPVDAPPTTKPSTLMAIGGGQ
jgi:Tfp pilus assembly protein PilN